jgi:hypothetical protein
MIDPKLNEIPVDNVTEDELTEEKLTEEERIARSRAAAARGLSINDTIARNANLSVGAQGVDTSGVAAGAGAGAGSTSVTPTSSDSPAPQIVPGARGTGMTPRADAPSGQTSTDRTKR